MSIIGKKVMREIDESIMECDSCGTSIKAPDSKYLLGTHDSVQPILGWIHFSEIDKRIYDRTFGKVAFPNLEVFIKFAEVSKDFCSRECLQKWLDRN